MMPQTATPVNAVPSADFNICSNALRALSMDMVQAANSGHPGAPMGMADFVTVLFRDFLHFNPQQPHWPGRDRFVLSNGHASALLYSVLHLTGYNVTLEHLKNFRQLGSPTAGHPEYGHLPGIETTTGPLGQGVANAVGMALAQKKLAAQYGSALFGGKVFVALGDGCLQEGISHEACELAGHWGLNNLVLLFDDNGISIDGATGLSTSTNILRRFEACGFDVTTADGHDEQAIHQALARSKNNTKPLFIAFKTTIGKGSPNRAGTAKAHGEPLGEDEIILARQQLNWPYAPFVVPETVKSSWLAMGEKGKAACANWQQALKNHPQRTEIEQRLSGVIPTETVTALEHLKQKAITQKPTMATRKASGQCIEAIYAHTPAFLSGSADLTGSNNTNPPTVEPFNKVGFHANYLHYGVREHAMAAVMNGLALHGGFIPAGGTFLVFADYLRPALRLSALMQQRVIYVLTHDSVGLGEDGPTHQPVEHLAMLRATPNVQVFRPCDLAETAECWQLALATVNAPSVLALSRQNLPALRTPEHANNENLCARGGYVLRDTPNPRAVLVASGSEVTLAVNAAEQLAAQNIAVQVVSMPSLSLFRQQDRTYCERILPLHLPRLCIEAASPLGWGELLRPQDTAIGMTTFGASGKGSEVMARFGFTVENIVTIAQKLVEREV